MARTDGVTGRPEALAAAKVPTLPDGELVVALSGGPDSAVVAWLATKARPQQRVKAVFVDHGWEHSAMMRTAAEAIAVRLRLALVVAAVDAGATETSARRARLAALTEAAAGGWILTGHHAGDVAETVLLNLVRGAGSTGLAGIPGARPPFLRPLIDVPADEVRAIATELGLPFVDDPSNLDSSHRRAVVRHELLPQMERVAPGVATGLTTTARLLRADDAALEERAGRVPVHGGRGWRSIPAGLLATLPDPIAGRVVRRALRELHPPYPGDSRDVASVLAAVAGTSAGLSGGLRCDREGAFVTVYDPADVPDPFPPVSLAVPGELRTATLVLGAEIAAVPRVARRGSRETWLDHDLAGDLVVRSAEEGERIEITGGTKLVRDAMAEGGVPTRLRRGWPVVVGRGKIAWIAGVRTAAWARPAAGAAAAVHLTTEKC